jgi:dolichol kinase
MRAELLTVVAQPDILAATGQSIATKLKDFVAPIAAVLVGAFGLKYLFGEEKSLAGFIGFLILGVFVYALIQWGEVILKSLGGIVNNIVS